MNKKDYIERAKNLILNRVRFHAPVVYDGHVDKRILFENGVDPNRPIFKFEKALNKRLIKAFELAQREEEFNLLIPFLSLRKIKEKSLKSLKHCVFYSPQNSPVLFVEMVNKLNINYASKSNYNLVFKDKFFKLNNQILNPNFSDFQLLQTEIFDGIFCDYREFVLNGNNHFITLSNKENFEKKISFELNIPLDKGYYFFKRQNGYISIENLLSNKKQHLNFVCKNARFSFSIVDGLENSVFCCINIKFSLTLKPKEKSFCFFNLGDSKLRLKSLSQIERFASLAKTKCYEIFNIRVKTKDAKFDQFFNVNLPKKIWINWLNNQPDFEKEKKYLTLKRLFLKVGERIDFVQFEKIGLKEIGVFNGMYYKKILITKGISKYLRVGKTIFHNTNALSDCTLKSKEPIELCFG